eukprot:GDKJ01008682.1.p1 GENE.GDKJ01008682.1~~GDKJ01008682.1.p1  ORF type:complete len:716 (-),score=202.95 GDKJ01008682.1:74-2221(-)
MLACCVGQPKDDERPEVEPEGPGIFDHLTNLQIGRPFGFNSIPTLPSSFNISRKAQVFREAEGVLTYAQGCKLPWLHDLDEEVPVDDDGEETDEASFSAFSRLDCIMNPDMALSSNSGFCRVLLCVEEARNLGIDDPQGPEEICPFFRVYLDETKVFESAVVARSPSPSWNDVLALQIHRPDSKIHIEILDFDPEVEGHDHVMGFVTIPVSMLRRDRTEEAWLTLTPSTAALQLVPPSIVARGYRAGSIRVVLHVDSQDVWFAELFARALPSAVESCQAYQSTGKNDEVVYLCPSERVKEGNLDLSCLYASLRVGSLIWWRGVIEPFLIGWCAVHSWKKFGLSLAFTLGAVFFILAPMYRWAVFLSFLVTIFACYPQSGYVGEEVMEYVVNRRKLKQQPQQQFAQQQSDKTGETFSSLSLSSSSNLAGQSSDASSSSPVRELSSYPAASIQKEATRSDDSQERSVDGVNNNNLSSSFSVFKPKRKMVGVAQMASQIRNRKPNASVNPSFLSSVYPSNPSGNFHQQGQHFPINSTSSPAAALVNNGSNLDAADGAPHFGQSQKKKMEKEMFFVKPSASDASSAKTALQALSTLLPNSSLLKRSLRALQTPADRLLVSGCILTELLATSSRVGFAIYSILILLCIAAWVVPAVLSFFLQLGVIAIILSVMGERSPLGRLTRAVLQTFFSSRPRGLKGGGTDYVRNAMDGLKRKLKEF